MEGLARLAIPSSTDWTAKIDEIIGFFSSSKWKYRPAAERHIHWTHFSQRARLTSPPPFCLLSWAQPWRDEPRRWRRTAVPASCTRGGSFRPAATQAGPAFKNGELLAAYTADVGQVGKIWRARDAREAPGHRPRKLKEEGQP